MTNYCEHCSQELDPGDNYETEEGEPVCAACYELDEL